MKIYYKLLTGMSSLDIYKVHRVLSDGTVIAVDKHGSYKHLDLFNDPKVILVEADD